MARIVSQVNQANGRVLRTTPSSPRHYAHAIYDQLKASEERGVPITFRIFGDPTSDRAILYRMKRCPPRSVIGPRVRRSRLWRRGPCDCG
jgi:hypothetical protein